MKTSIYHNILWSKYKGGVFSELHQISANLSIEYDFTHIALTEKERVGLAQVDKTYHNYPYRVIFHKSYEEVSVFRRIFTLFFDVWRNPAELILLPGLGYSEYWFMLLAARIRKKYVLFFSDSTILDNPPSLMKKYLKRIFISQCHGALTYGERSREYLIYYGMQPELIYIRCQAAALPTNYDLDKVIQYRKGLISNTSSPRFCYVGRLSKEKNISSLLTAFNIVLREFPQASLTVVGSGGLLNDLKEKSIALNIQEKVLFKGSLDTDQLSSIYIESTCLILPSLSEPWGLVVNEALSYGCPVVVSNKCGCVDELVVEGVTGYFFEPNDVQELASKMILATTVLAKNDKTTANCLDLISSFSSNAAAIAIDQGCTATAKRFLIEK